MFREMEAVGGQCKSQTHHCPTPATSDYLHPPVQFVPHWGQRIIQNLVTFVQNTTQSTLVGPRKQLIGGLKAPDLRVVEMGDLPQLRYEMHRAILI